MINPMVYLCLVPTVISGLFIVAVLFIRPLRRSLDFNVIVIISTALFIVSVMGPGVAAAKYTYEHPMYWPLLTKPVAVYAVSTEDDYFGLNEGHQFCSQTAAEIFIQGERLREAERGSRYGAFVFDPIPRRVWTATSTIIDDWRWNGNSCPK